MAGNADDGVVFSDDEAADAPVDEDELIAEREILNENVPDVRAPCATLYELKRAQ